jgi:hypothetical protein
MIFSTEDYERIRSDEKYIHALEGILERSHVVFVGYGLRDQYVVESVWKTEKLNRVFGVGPHFLISDSCAVGLPTSVRAIKYFSGSHSDHYRAKLWIRRKPRFGERSHPF